MLSINLDGFLSWRRTERIACIVRRHPDVRNVSTYVDESSYLGVISNLADHSTSPGMTNEDDRTILHGDNPTGRVYVVRQRGQRILNGYNVKTACFKDWNDFG